MLNHDNSNSVLSDTETNKSMGLVGMANRFASNNSQLDSFGNDNTLNFNHSKNATSEGIGLPKIGVPNSGRPVKQHSENMAFNSMSPTTTKR